MDLAAAAAGARATRISLLLAGPSRDYGVCCGPSTSSGRGQALHILNEYATTGSGPTRQSAVFDIARSE
jgi:hypothetical protein